MGGTDRASPAWLSLADDLEGIIRGGYALPGEKMPSLRRIRKDSGRSKTTVQRAFRSLEDRGLIRATDRSDKCHPLHLCNLRSATLRSHVFGEDVKMQRVAPIPGEYSETTLQEIRLCLFRGPLVDTVVAEFQRRF